MADPKAASLQHDAAALDLSPTRITTARIYLIEAPLTPDQVARVASGLLADPVLEVARNGSAPLDPGLTATIEVHPLPGVMDPAAQSVRDAIRELLSVDALVSTGWRYDFAGLTPAQADTLARRLLANPVVQAIHNTPHHPVTLPKGHPANVAVRHIALRALADPALERLSRDSHLFLDLAEMRAIQDHYLTLDRDPTEIELETLAQTWSEHCVHKTLKSTIRYRSAGDGANLPLLASPDPINWSNRPGHTLNPDGSITIHNLLKSTVAAATHELIADGLDWCLSVFVDNAGIIAFDDDHAVCVKVETHNHPSALEPYGGAATGIGGCIRDILGTGLGAKPIASTDVFCVAWPDGWSDTATKPVSDAPEPGSGRVAQWPGARAEGVPSNAASSRATAFSPRLDRTSPLPSGCLHPRRVLTEIVAGVRDYGNRMGIPTVSGAVWFDNRHIGNPLVFCGCIGVMPRSAIGGKARPGDRIIALGGRTGRDGIHGATFSSAELTDTHADEFSHAVQIGNAIEEKRVLDVVLRARGEARSGRVAEWRSGNVNGSPSGTAASPSPRPGPRLDSTLPLDHFATLPLLGSCLFSAITDCGAGGFSSAVGEMAADLGATVHLERAPLKYAGLTPTEIWISEAQERMVLAVPTSNLDALSRICREEGVEMADLGEFGTPARDLILTYNAVEFGRLSMHFLHEGIPTPTREAEWGGGGSGRAAEWQSGNATSPTLPAPLGLTAPTWPLGHSATLPLLALLSHPNIASKHWIIRQYDHEVQGRTVVKPLVGPGQGPSDAAVIEPVPGAGRGLAISQGLATGYMTTASASTDPTARAVGRGTPTASTSASSKAGSESQATQGDPYLMTLAAIDECVRNLVCVGADPARIAILDNFCWPSCKKPTNLGSLVRAAEACYDGAKAYRTPFVSGKDSLNNQFTIPGEDGSAGVTIEIPPTLLITGIGIVPSLDRVVTMDAKRPGNLLVLVGQTQNALAGSHLVGIDMAQPSSPALHTFPRTDLTLGPRLAHAVHSLITADLIASAHDVSDGGLLCAVAEMLIAAQPRGTQTLGAELLPPDPCLDPLAFAFGESPSRYILEVAPHDIDAVRRALVDLPCDIIGQLTSTAHLTWSSGAMNEPIDRLRDAWTRTLDW